jgi:hypothetical protein
VSECHVDGCGRPVTDAYVCTDCATRAERALGEVNWLLHELDLVLTRQTARSEHVGGHSPDRPLAFAWDAADLRWALENTVTTWARVILTEKPKVSDPSGLSTGLVAAWMTGQVEWLRHHPAGHEAVDEITACVAKATRAVDVRPARIYAGPCTAANGDRQCGHDLYADPSSAVVTCPACRARYDVAERRAWLMDSARDHLATAREASRLCWTLLGDLVTTAMIRGYVHRGKLAPHGKRVEGGKEAALFRIGDVIDVATRARWDEDEQRKTRKAGAA